MTGIRPAIAALMFLTAGCNSGWRDVHVPFAAVVGPQAVTCGSPTAAGSLTDLRFYLSDIRLLDDSGEPVELKLDLDERWQGDGIALIDLEDGTGACRNGTPGIHESVTGKLPTGDYRGISFVIGVPFELNHGDPLAAMPPLDDSTMHWHWQSGYKFLRAGFEDDTRSHWLHLGSAGCEGSIRSITRCRLPNRVIVTIDDYEPGDRLVVDLAVLFDALRTSADPTASCSSGPAEQSCEPVFAALGLDHASGNQATTQRLVRRRH